MFLESNLDVPEQTMENMQSFVVRDEEPVERSRKRVGHIASKRVATSGPADALEDLARTLLPDDNVTSNPDVLCSEIVSSTIVTGVDLEKFSERAGTPPL